MYKSLMLLALLGLFVVPGCGGGEDAEYTVPTEAIPNIPPPAGRGPGGDGGPSGEAGPGKPGGGSSPMTPPGK